MKMVYYVQSGVLATEKTDPCAITIKFKAPLDDSSDENAGKEINYEEFRVADELKLLKAGEFERYAYIQCLKICYYVQKVRRKEILQMSAEFVRDDYDNVWFVYANKIQYRKIADLVNMAGVVPDAEEEKQAMAFQQAQTDLFTRELQEYQDAIEAQRDNQVMNQMRDYMAEYYSEMKKDMGIDANYGEDED